MFDAIVLAVILNQRSGTDWNEEPFSGKPICTDSNCSEPKKEKEEAPEIKQKSEEPEKIPEVPKVDPPIKPSKVPLSPVLTVDRIDRHFEENKWPARAPKDLLYTVRTEGSYKREYKVGGQKEVLDLVYDRFRKDPRVKEVVVEERSGKVRIRYTRDRSGKWEVKP